VDTSSHRLNLAHKTVRPLVDTDNYYLLRQLFVPPAVIIYTACTRQYRIGLALESLTPISSKKNFFYGKSSFDKARCFAFRYRLFAN